MKNLILGFILFLIALVFTTLLSALFIPFSIFRHIILFKWLKGADRVGKYFKQMGIMLDIFACISLQTPLNLFMTKGKDFYKFGKRDDTVSYVIAVNYYNGHLSKFGMFWAKLLIFVDFKAKKEGLNHLSKTLNNRNERDLKICEKLL